MTRPDKTMTSKVVTRADWLSSLDPPISRPAPVTWRRRVNFASDWLCRDSSPFERTDHKEVATPFRSKKEKKKKKKKNSCSRKAYVSSINGAEFTENGDTLQRERRPFTENGGTSQRLRRPL